MSSKRLNFILISIFILSCIFFISLSLFFTSLSKKHSDTDFESEFKDSTDRKPNLPTIIIDAGHGGEDGGTVGIDGTYEKELNLAIALELKQILQSEGMNVRLTRETDILLYDRNSDYYGHKKAQDAAARIAISNEYENAVFISIHMNSFYQSKYSGLQVYYSENSPLSSLLAETVQSLTKKNLQPNNTRKIKPSNDNIYILKNITHPAILIECGFLSNPTECKKLNSSEYRTQLCMVIYCAIEEYLQNTSQDT